LPGASGFCFFTQHLYMVRVTGSWGSPGAGGHRELIFSGLYRRLKPERYTCGGKGSPGAALRSWGWGHREESFCLAVIGPSSLKRVPRSGGHREGVTGSIFLQGVAGPSSLKRPPRAGEGHRGQLARTSPGAFCSRLL
jgi:hypothetical protein